MHSPESEVKLSRLQHFRAVTEVASASWSRRSSITPDVMAHRDELSQIVGDEITRIIQEQRGLETRYEHLIAQRTSLKALSNKSKFNENQEQVKEVARALRESTKELCRNLKVCARAARRRGDVAMEPCAGAALIRLFFLRPCLDCSHAPAPLLSPSGQP